MLIMLMAMMVVTPSTSAYFWSNSPTSWGYDDDPAQIPATPDGTGYAKVVAGDGQCYVELSGGSSKVTADPIYWIDPLVGDSLMFCVAYDIRAYMKDTYQDTWCIANLSYYIYEDTDWIFGDAMTADVQTCYPAIQSNTDDGWLYVYVDYNYALEPDIKLTFYTYTKFWDGYQWDNFGNSPQEVSVFFKVWDNTT